MSEEFYEDDCQVRISRDKNANFNAVLTGRIRFFFASRLKI